MKVILLLLASILLQAELPWGEDSRAVRIMQSERRIALIIGNSNYRGILSKLKNPVNDARAIKRLLEQRNFNVIYIENATKREMKDKLHNFYTKIQKGGVGLLYFAGHGIEVESQNYIIPIDANIQDKDDIEFEAFALNRITKKMQNAKNRLNIVILDACRNDPFTRGGGGLAKTDPIGLFVSFATSAGKVASDGASGDNGLFTKYLIKYIQQPNMTLQNVFKKTREMVYEESNQRQFPAIYDQTIRGNFYFTLNITNNIISPSQNKIDKLEPIAIQQTMTAPSIPTITPQTAPPIIVDQKTPTTIHSENITLMHINYENKPFTKRYTWIDAKKYCNKKGNNWRLAKKNELEKLLTKNKNKGTNGGHFIKNDFVNNMPRESVFWTIDDETFSTAWFVDFSDGYISSQNILNENYAMCVYKI